MNGGATNHDKGSAFLVSRYLRNGEPVGATNSVSQALGSLGMSPESFNLVDDRDPESVAENSSPEAVHHF